MIDSRINAKGVQFVVDHLANIPRPDREAHRLIRQWLAGQGVHIDPDRVDVVTLHYRPDDQGYVAAVQQTQSMTQALLGNWQGESDNNLIGALFANPWAGTFPQGPLKLVDRLPTLGFGHQGAAFEVYNGLFQRSSPARYDASTHIQVPAEAFQRFIEALDFHQPFKAMLDAYWQEHQDTHRLASKLNFIAACNAQVNQGRLSDAARELAWQAAGMMPQRFKIRVSTLSIYGYAATDLLYINAPHSDLTLLYMPGNSSPLLEFASENQLKDWVGDQCKDPARREALKQHFRLADRPQGLDFSGLDTALEGLGDYPDRHRLPPEHGYFNDDGVWPPRTYVNYKPGKYNPKLTGDMFAALTERQRQRSYDDADFVITTDSQVTKAKWRGYLANTLNLLAPLCLVVPGLAPLLALGGIAQLGLGLDQVINGHSLKAKQDGVGDIAWGLFNAVPLATEGTAGIKALFEFKSDGFVIPREVNGQLGYPLSPTSPPRLPEPEGAEYFHHHEPITPLDEGDPAVAGSVIRLPHYDGELDDLECSIETYNARVVYDLEHDAFIIKETVNEVEPQAYIAVPGSRDLVALDRQRPVTDAMRTRTLRALGVDLPLPVTIPTPAPDSAPIPKLISSLWVGDKVISEPLLANLAANAARLSDSEYSMRLFLSKASPTAYEQNARLLAARAPGLQVLPLEEQGFFRAFRQSRYYAQYEAALDGNGGIATNYASATDVLRYRMLHHEGGLYMDVDDFLLPDGKGETIDQVELRTPPDGLLLPPPMSNEKMSMNCLYNTSLIGSHPGNPLLDAISDEMLARYQTHADFYESRPSLEQDPSGFYRYANTLSYLTGPALLTEVVDRHLTGLRTLRQIINLHTMPRVNTYPFINPSQANTALKQLLPLNRFAGVGGNHSWVRN
ncbi:TPA: mannosyltransferase [Pseudomonas putida]|uniref:dermonecrotic toxin domain-containing protein n=1 Tax=Pseudomonas putida TaxID=303 RepID=UPI002363E242|nr:DUF6543 domain-containing protein [Pseudomonas putida]MDD2012030.1 mannosyltransferase [Pseudomonas putida]HDS1780437.1 mannosyltransferase [Pseudomonas putida]